MPKENYDAGNISIMGIDRYNNPAQGYTALGQIGKGTDLRLFINGDHTDESNSVHLNSDRKLGVFTYPDSGNATFKVNGGITIGEDTSISNGTIRLSNNQFQFIERNIARTISIRTCTYDGTALSLNTPVLGNLSNFLNIGMDQFTINKTGIGIYDLRGPISYTIFPSVLLVSQVSSTPILVNYQLIWNSANTVTIHSLNSSAVHIDSKFTVYMHEPPY